jgi:hypothetical protein
MIFPTQKELHEAQVSDNDIHSYDCTFDDVDDYSIPSSFLVVECKSNDDVLKDEVLMAPRINYFMPSFVCNEHEAKVDRVRDSDSHAFHDLYLGDPIYDTTRL